MKWSCYFFKLVPLKPYSVLRYFRLCLLGWIGQARTTHPSVHNRTTGLRWQRHWKMCTPIMYWNFDYKTNEIAYDHNWWRFSIMSEQRLSKGKVCKLQCKLYFVLLLLCHNVTNDKTSLRFVERRLQQTAVK